MTQRPPNKRKSEVVIIVYLGEGLFPRLAGESDLREVFILAPTQTVEVGKHVFVGATKALQVGRQFGFPCFFEGWKREMELSTWKSVVQGPTKQNGGDESFIYFTVLWFGVPFPKLVVKAHFWCSIPRPSKTPLPVVFGKSWKTEEKPSAKVGFLGSFENASSWGRTLDTIRWLRHLQLVWSSPFVISLSAGKLSDFQLKETDIFGRHSKLLEVFPKGISWRFRGFRGSKPPSNWQCFLETSEIEATSWTSAVSCTQWWSRTCDSSTSVWGPSGGVEGPGVNR